MIAAVATVEKPHADLQATRKELDAADPRAQTEATYRRRAEQCARGEAKQVAAMRVGAQRASQTMEQVWRA